MDRDRHTTIESDLWLGCVSVLVHRYQWLQFPDGIRQTFGELLTCHCTTAPAVTTGPTSLRFSCDCSLRDLIAPKVCMRKRLDRSRKPHLTAKLGNRLHPGRAPLNQLQENRSDTAHGRLWLLWPVIMAGEAIFLLPFVLPRLFRPTMLEAWGISNLDFGLAFSCYGVVAMIAYGLGGPLADRFPPPWLMCAALVATATGGFALLGNPNRVLLCCVYAYFGLTTILLFWSAMLKVTHSLGGSDQQATAFGLLDAGRGLFAAMIATAMTLMFAQLLPVEEEASPDNLATALQSIIIFTIIVVATSAFLVPLALLKLRRNHSDPHRHPVTRRSIYQLVRRPDIWLHGLVVLCAYCGYKSIDNYGIFSVDVYQSTDLQASQLTTLTFWARPFAAISAGLVADRFSHFKSMAVLFLLAAIGNSSLAFLAPPNLQWFGLMMVSVSTAATMYGLRGIYFSVFDDLHIPPQLLGTAAGFVSLIGFLPDVFFGALTGFLIDEYPGRQGHQYVFGMVGCVSVIGLIASLWNSKHTKHEATAPVSNS